MKVTVNPPTTVGRVDLGGGLRGWSRFTITVTEQDRMPGTVELEVVWDPQLDRYAAKRVEVFQDKWGSAITGSTMRMLRIQDYLRRGFRMAVLADMGDRSENFWEFDFPALRADGPTPSNIEHVGRIYRFAQLADFPPAKMVAEVFGLPARTAAFWIAKARAAGHIASKAGDDAPA